MDQFDFRQREHARMIGRVNRTAWMSQSEDRRPTLGERIRERVRRG